MSLIHTCNRGQVNPFDYLTALQKNSSEVFKNPRNWLPWNYQDGLPVNDSYLTNVIGNPLDTTVALVYIVFCGVLERRSGVKIVAAHGGQAAQDQAACGEARQVTASREGISSCNTNACSAHPVFSG